MKDKNAVIGLSCLIYKCLLTAYPTAFRRRFQTEMLQAFHDMCADKQRTRGGIGLVSLWATTLLDLVKSSVVEQFSAVDRWALFFLLMGCCDGLFAAYVDFHNNEVQATVLVLLVCSFVIGAIRPKGAWRWALAVGLGVPLCHIFGKWFGLNSQYPVKPNDMASFIAVVPAFIGSYFGAFVRIAVSLPGDPPGRPGGAS